MYNHNKAQQSKNRVHISWDILYPPGIRCCLSLGSFNIGLFQCSICRSRYTLSHKIKIQILTCKRYILTLCYTHHLVIWNWVSEYSTHIMFSYPLGRNEQLVCLRLHMAFNLNLSPRNEILPIVATQCDPLTWAYFSVLFAAVNIH